MHTRLWTLAALGLSLAACDPDPGLGGPLGETANDGDSDEGEADPTQGDQPDPGDAGAGYSTDVLGTLDLPWPPYDYDPAMPAHFQAPGVTALDNTPAQNPITDAGATLGRVLFYDTALSANHTISCASCHQQDAGFSDTATFSEGFEGGLTGRNSMSLANARFYEAGHFFWDERANTLEDQVLMPIQDSVEMGLTLEQLVARVEGQPYYAELFTMAFGDPAVDSDRIARALAQFVRAIGSYDTAWDEGIAATGSPAAPFPNYTAQQNMGKAVFFGPGRCAPCHLEQAGPPAPPPGAPGSNMAIFMLAESANNGLDGGLNNADNGLGDAFGDPSLNGVFKSPSLRNVELTAPYMHDGRFATLAEVVEFYDSGVQDHPNLDPRMRMPGGQPQRLGLSQQEKQALVEFMRTLTDDEMARDVRFSDPFR